ncbi:MAG: acylphosphatase [Minwuia sp.]|nr:acylphosphatase [Minwuia sp.]
MTEDTTPVAMHVTIHGRVQGVWFRGFTVRNARDLGVAGWVRNRRDETVEALFTGEAGRVKALLDRCRQGPPASRVDHVVAIPCPMPEPVPSGFAQMDTA